MWLGSTRLPLFEVLVEKGDFRPDAGDAPEHCAEEPMRPMLVLLAELGIT
jgi:hypothetical protein